MLKVTETHKVINPKSLSESTRLRTVDERTVTIIVNGP